MRLIDADAVMRNNLFTERDRGFLLDATTIDAVEVVRCKDCKYAFLFDADDERDGLCGQPSNNAWDIWDEFYCGRGVKHELVE